MKARKLNYRFHDPNPPEVTADFLEKLFIEVNAPKIERAIQEMIHPASSERENSTSSTPEPEYRPRKPQKRPSDPCR